MGTYILCVYVAEEKIKDTEPGWETVCWPVLPQNTHPNNNKGQVYCRSQNAIPVMAIASSYYVHLLFRPFRVRVRTVNVSAPVDSLLFLVKQYYAT